MKKKGSGKSATGQAGAAAGSALATKSNVTEAPKVKEKEDAYAAAESKDIMALLKGLHILDGEDRHKKIADIEAKVKQSKLKGVTLRATVANEIGTQFLDYLRRYEIIHQGNSALEARSVAWDGAHDILGNGLPGLLFEFYADDDLDNGFQDLTFLVRPTILRYERGDSCCAVNVALPLIQHSPEGPLSKSQSAARSWMDSVVLNLLTEHASDYLKENPHHGLWMLYQPAEVLIAFRRIFKRSSPLISEYLYAVQSRMLKESRATGLYSTSSVFVELHNLELPSDMPAETIIEAMVRFFRNKTDSRWVLPSLKFGLYVLFSSLIHCSQEAIYTRLRRTLELLQNNTMPYTIRALGLVEIDLSHLDAQDVMSRIIAHQEAPPEVAKLQKRCGILYKLLLGNQVERDEREKYFSEYKEIVLQLGDDFNDDFVKQVMTTSVQMLSTARIDRVTTARLVAYSLDAEAMKRLKTVAIRGFDVSSRVVQESLVSSFKAKWISFIDMLTKEGLSSPHYDPLLQSFQKYARAASRDLELTSLFQIRQFLDLALAEFTEEGTKSIADLLMREFQDLSMSEPRGYAEGRWTTDRYSLTSDQIYGTLSKSVPPPPSSRPPRSFRTSAEKFERDYLHSKPKETEFPAGDYSWGASVKDEWQRPPAASNGSVSEVERYEIEYQRREENRMNNRMDGLLRSTDVDYQHINSMGKGSEPASNSSEYSSLYEPWKSQYHQTDFEFDFNVQDETLDEPNDVVTLSPSPPLSDPLGLVSQETSDIVGSIPLLEPLPLNRPPSPPDSSDLVAKAIASMNLGDGYVEDV